MYCLHYLCGRQQRGSMRIQCDATGIDPRPCENIVHPDQQCRQKKAAEEAARFPVYHKRAPALAEPFHALPVSRPVVRKLCLAGIESYSQKEVSGGSAL